MVQLSRRIGSASGIIRSDPPPDQFYHPSPRKRSVFGEAYMLTTTTRDLTVTVPCLVMVRSCHACVNFAPGFFHADAALWQALRRPRAGRYSRRYAYPVRSYIVCENKNKCYRRKFMQAAAEKLRIWKKQNYCSRHEFGGGTGVALLSVLRWCT